MADPFLITGPAVISFSGGRTSGYMLRRILDAHGGALPPDVVVCFANTGREMPATLDFVRDVGAFWNVPIVWLEFTGRRQDGYQVVSHNSAARNGEPFTRLLSVAPTLPGPTRRSCTAELKVRTMSRWVRATLGWSHWNNVIGLRADERGRVEKAKQRAPERWQRMMPLADAFVTLADVQAFWRDQPFDLMLAGKWEGNCDGCFLKSRSAIMRMHRDHPERMRWWAASEAEPRGRAGRGRTFNLKAAREPYAELARITAATPMLPLDETMIEGGQECGQECGI